MKNGCIQGSMVNGGRVGAVVRCEEAEHIRGGALAEERGRRRARLEGVVVSLAGKLTH